jgi:glycosyltransferase involved in cell wall biosynthesis
MKIGIDTLFESPKFPTGATGYMINLLRALAQIDRGNEYFIFVSDANRHLYDVRQENFHYVTCWASNERRAARIATQQFQTPGLARKYGISVFNSPGNTAPLFLPCKSVLTIKTMHHYHFSEVIGWQRTLFRRAMVQLSARRADLIIANSISNRNDIIDFLNVPAERVAIIHEAVDRSCFRCDLDSDEVTEDLRNKGITVPYILNVSSIWPYKNQMTLLEAYAALVEKYQIPHQLVLVGAGDEPEYVAAVHRAVQAHGLEARVRFTGYLPHLEIVPLYYGADVFVYPSLFETFGLTLLEAMACGTPIISSDRSSLPEILGDAGLLVNPEEPGAIAAAILRVISDSKLRSDLVERGTRRVNDFSWEKTARETRDAYLAAGQGIAHAMPSPIVADLPSDSCRSGHGL